jgi:hypothetical protein
VGNDASDSIIEALEEYTVPLFNNNPLHGAMVKMMGGCPVEIRRSVIENATQYGESDDNALYGLAVFDLFDENLQPQVQYLPIQQLRDSRILFLVVVACISIGQS